MNCALWVKVITIKTIIYTHLFVNGQIKFNIPLSQTSTLILFLMVVFFLKNLEFVLYSIFFLNFTWYIREPVL